AADVIVTATGLEMLFLGGMQVTVDGVPLVAADHLAYKGMMLEGVPNLAMSFGYMNASWTLKAELTCEYVCRILQHLRASGTTTATAINADPSLVAEPAMPLSSGYITRAAETMPQQGSRFPWQVYQNYLRDYRATRMSDVDDGVLQFSGSASTVA
ncbi:MAG: FAD-containing monooxygenase EthA, partial [Actinomycetes bacterium]